MPVTFSQIANNTASVTYPWEGETITVVFYPNKITDTWVAATQAGVADGNQLIAEIIKSWDIFEDDEHTVMVSPERLSEFGIPFKEQLVQEIVEHMRPNRRAARTK